MMSTVHNLTDVLAAYAAAGLDVERVLEGWAVYGDEGASIAYCPDVESLVEFLPTYIDGTWLDGDDDDSMDGDFNSAMAAVGMGTDEDYGYFGNDE
jgi:hypothetical protein